MNIFDIFRKVPKPTATSVFERPGVSEENIQAILLRARSAGKFDQSLEIAPGIHVNHPLLGEEAMGSAFGYNKLRIPRAIVAGIQKKSLRVTRDALRFTRPNQLGEILLSSDAGRETVIHEMIHASHISDRTNPFFQEELSKTPKLSQIFGREDKYTRKYYADIFNMTPKSERRFMVETERLAFSHQHDLGLLRRASELGIATHMTRASHTAPGRSKSLIQGLRDSGFACHMRKILSRFGSGWQGLDPEFQLVPEKIGMREHMLTLKKGEQELGYMTYSIGPGGVAHVGATQIFEGNKGQGLGKSMYVEAMKHAKAQGAHKFRSDVTINETTGEQSVTEEAANVWKSAERAGIAEKIQGERGWVANLFHLEKNIMNLGEGAAVAKAGGATVPSVLKATSRVMKCAL